MLETFCPLPWIGVATRNNGDLRVCCHSTNSKGKGFAVKQDGSLYSAGKDEVAAFRNAELLKSIRLEMLDGKWPENCIRCKTETEAGIRSRIQYERTLNSSIIDYAKAKSITGKNGEIDTNQVPMSLLDIRFGNHCNLACRTCNPTESSRWYGDHFALYGDTFKYGDQKLKLEKSDGGQVTLSDNIFDWFEQESFKQKLPELLRDVRQIYMAGGEPLKTKAHVDFLKKIIQMGRSKEITLEYNTNGYVIPDNLWELWSEFAQVKVGLSIDSVYEMNDYIRYPSKWDVLAKNIERFDKSGDHFVVWLALTVHCYNIFYLPELITWRIKSNFQKFNNTMDNLIFSDHPLHNPTHLNVQILPKEIKLQVAQKFEKFKATVPDLIKENDFMRSYPDESVERVNQFLDSYVSFMNQQDQVEAFPKFKKYTENLDRVRGDSFAKIFPEWQQLLSDHA